MGGFAAADVADETREEAGYFHRSFAQRGELLVFEKLEPVGDDQLRMHFVQRSARLAQELAPLAECQAPLAFAKMTHNRQRRPPDL